MPGQGGALDPHGEFPDAGQHRELAHLLRLDLAVWSFGQHRVNPTEERQGLFLFLAFKRRGHQGSRGLRDGASGSLERDVLDDTVRELHVERELITAERIEALRPSRSALKLAEVPRMLAVVDDHFLIEVPKFAAH